MPCDFSDFIELENGDLLNIGLIERVESLSVIINGKDMYEDVSWTDIQNVKKRIDKSRKEKEKVISLLESIDSELKEMNRKLDELKGNSPKRKPRI